MRDSKLHHRLNPYACYRTYVEYPREVVSELKSIPKWTVTRSVGGALPRGAPIFCFQLYYLHTEPDPATEEYDEAVRRIFPDPEAGARQHQEFWEKKEEDPKHAE
jgi:hypothetical protein